MWGGPQAAVTRARMARAFEDPAGARVHVGQVIVDHMLEWPEPQDDRERFFPFIPELVGSPAEIWAGFARSAESGRVAFRRRYVKVVELDRDRAFAFVADSENGEWSGLTFICGDRRYLATLRSGLRLHRRGD